MSLRIHAAMSLPRAALTTPMMTIFRAMLPLGIPVTEYPKHAYWHQALTRKLEDIIEDKFDVALVIDWDSMFVATQVQEMISIFEQNPWIDALMAVEQRRGGADIPMFTQKDDAGMAVRALKTDERDGRVAKCESGHFGLTLLRTEKLKRMLRPWFFDIPNQSGQWEDEPWDGVSMFQAPAGFPHHDKCSTPNPDEVQFHIEAIRAIMGVPKDAKVDNDIWFWKQWHRSGNNLYVAGDINIGHLQEVVTVSTPRTHQDYNLEPGAFFDVFETSKEVVGAGA